MPLKLVFRADIESAPTIGLFLRGVEGAAPYNTARHSEKC